LYSNIIYILDSFVLILGTVNCFKNGDNELLAFTCVVNCVSVGISILGFSTILLSDLVLLALICGGGGGVSGITCACELQRYNRISIPSDDVINTEAPATDIMNPHDCN